jgi:hypothetical protein
MQLISLSVPKGRWPWLQRSNFSVPTARRWSVARLLSYEMVNPLRMSFESCNMTQRSVHRLSSTWMRSPSRFLPRSVPRWGPVAGSLSCPQMPAAYCTLNALRQQQRTRTFGS